MAYEWRSNRLTYIEAEIAWKYLYKIESYCCNPSHSQERKVSRLLLSRYDRQVFNVASRLLEQDAVLAPFHAAAKAENCRKVGDSAGARMWLDVIRAIEATSDAGSVSSH